jgi:hypothetical protein
MSTSPHCRHPTIHFFYFLFFIIIIFNSSGIIVFSVFSFYLVDTKIDQGLKFKISSNSYLIFMKLNTVSQK